MSFLLKYLRLTMLSSVVLSACVDIEGPVPQPVEPSDILANVLMSTTGVVMQIGDSVALSLTAVAMDKGEIAITNPSSIVWTSDDEARVRVDSTGRIWGNAVNSAPVLVIGSWTYNGVTRADTIPVTVTATRYDLTELKLVALDSQRVGGTSLFGSPRVRVDGYVNNSLAIEGAILPLYTTAPVSITRPTGQNYYSIDNPTTYLGDFTVYVGGNVYGTEMLDSIVFTGIYPTTVVAGFADILSWESNPSSISPPSTEATFVQPCAVFLLTVFTSSRPIDIVFSDSASGSSADCELSDPTNSFLFLEVVSGNVENVPPGTFGYLVRKSATIGEVKWHVRYADTKEIIPAFGGRYIVKTPE